MTITVSKGTAVLLFSLMLAAPIAWALDAEDDDSADGSNQDTTSETEDAAAESGAKFNPPHDDHVNSTPEHPDHKSGASATGGADIAEAATDPTAILTQFQNFFWTNSTSDNKNVANTYLFQAVLPLSNSNILRPAIPLVETGGPNGKFGMGDLFLLDLEIEHASFGAWGWGAAGSLPTATNKQIGAGKWSAGPAGVFLYKKIPKTLLGVLAYNVWSFAGDSDRDDVNTLSFQPIWLSYTSWGYFGWTDQTASVDWKHDNNFTLPLGLRFGTVWKAKTPLKTEIGFYYNLTNHDRDSAYGVKFTASFIKPNILRH